MIKLTKKIYDLIIKLIGKEMFFYLVFGFLTTAINYIAYYICNIIIKMSAGVSTTIAFIFGVIFAYITNKIWVFESKTNTKKDLIKEIISFISARLITYFIDLILMIILVDKLHFNSLITKLLVNILVIILNYIFSKLFVFNNKKINFKSILKKYYLYLIYLAYMIFLFILMLKHEPWRDEAQSYLMVRDLSIPEIFKILKYEGHPFLYYIVIYISKYLGYRTVNIISYILSSISAYLILFKSKSHKLVSFTFLTSFSFVFCTIFGRSYSLILLLITIISLLYNDRYTKPIIFSILIGLLLNIHILLFGFCLSIIIIQVYDYIKLKNKNKKILIGILIEILSILIMVLQLMGGSGMSNLNISIFPFFTSMLKIFITFNGNKIMGFILFLTFLGMLAYAFFKDKKIFLILLFSFGFMSCVDAYVFTLNFYHSCIILFIMTFCLLNDKSIIYKILYLIMACSSFYVNIEFVSNDLKYNYSDAYNVSKYFTNQEETKGNILCMYDDLCTSIIPYLEDTEYKFLAYNRNMREYVFVIRDIASSDAYLYDISLDNIDYIISPIKLSSIYEPFLLKFKKNNQIIQEYETKETIIADESYIVYRVVK